MAKIRTLNTLFKMADEKKSVVINFGHPQHKGKRLPAAWVQNMNARHLKHLMEMGSIWK